MLGTDVEQFENFEVLEILFSCSLIVLDDLRSCMVLDWIIIKYQE